MLDGPSVVGALKECGVTHVIWVPDSEFKIQILLHVQDMQVDFYTVAPAPNAGTPAVVPARFRSGPRFRRALNGYLCGICNHGDG